MQQPQTVAGDAPDAGQPSTSDPHGARHRQRSQAIRLPHTGMRVPHTRLGIGSLVTLPTGNGVAVHADLLLDGTPVGTIVGNGGALELYSPNDKFGWTRMRDFVAACRLLGSGVSEETVLDRLIDEHQQAAMVAKAGSGQTAIRRRDPNGDLDHAFILDTAIDATTSVLPRTLTDYIGREPAHPYEQWQWWDGQRWNTLQPETASETA